MADNIFTLKEYIDNPGGKGSAVGIGLQQTKNHFNEQLRKIESDITLQWYTNPKKNILVAHVSIPSQSSDTVRYDVVFEFQLGEHRDYGDYVIYCPVKVFSNAPSFVYTYAYAFNKQKKLIPWLKEKYPDVTLKTEPKSKNPYNQIYFERTLYLAALYIHNKRGYIPLALGISTTVNKVNLVEKYIQDMNTLDNIRKTENEEKSKLAGKQIKPAPKYPVYDKRRAAPRKPSGPESTSSTKSPKKVTSAVKGTKGTKGPKKATKGTR